MAVINRAMFDCRNSLYFCQSWSASSWYFLIAEQQQSNLKYSVWADGLKYM
jgi:hypothetical protein